MATYHITHRHSFENCFGPPGENAEIMALWKQVGTDAKENGVDIKFFKISPSQHTFFILMEAEDYSNIEKAIGPCKKTGDLQITPVVEQIFY